MLGFFQSKAKGLQVGVDFLPTGVAVVGVSTANSNLGQVIHSDFLPSVGVIEQSKMLQDWVDRQGLKQAPCVSLIAKHDVQMFQLEKPAVEEEEMLQAISWKLKDLISFDINAAVVDMFRFPASAKNSSQQVNAIVANESVVASYVDKINQSGLELTVIDIHDLVGKNLGRVNDFSEQTIAILQFAENDGLLTIYHDRDLYVARDIKIGLLDIEAALSEDESLYDKMLLELQRSMDYFESFYGLGLVQKMLVFPQSPASERMASYLQNYVSYELDFLQVDSVQEQQMDSHCFAAYCAALRGQQG